MAAVPVIVPVSFGRWPKVNQIRHHIDIRDASARDGYYKPLPATIPEAPTNERLIGLQMAEMAAREGNRPTRFLKDRRINRDEDEVCNSILSVLIGEMNVTDIVRAVSDDLGYDVSWCVVRERLRKNLEDKVQRREVTYNKILWSLRHITTSDRLSMAIAEGKA